MDTKKWRDLADTIPAYWEEHLEEKIKAIHEKQIIAGVGSASFGMITDMHWVTNQKHSAALLKKVLTDCAIPYFFNAGDLFSGQGICNKEDNIKDFIEFRKLFSKIESKCLMAEGNHDAVYSTFQAPDYYARNLPLSEFYEYYFRFQAQYPDRHFGADGTYYYVDLPLQKTRLIVLNTHDIPDDSENEEGRPIYHKFRASGTGIRQEQLYWFANTALDLPAADWTAVLCTHESPAEVGRDGVCNFGLIHDIINAFKRHAKWEGSSEYEEECKHYNAKIVVDYTGKGGNFAVWVSGHSHCDKHTIIDGILSVTTLNDGMHNSERSAFQHTAQTITEQAFDIWTIDKHNHKLYATRIGCGNDREFEYETH